jgi:hypothetical protein
MPAGLIACEGMTCWPGVRALQRIRQNGIECFAPVSIALRLARMHCKACWGVRIFGKQVSFSDANNE